jgi:hypothetical protein
MIRSCRHYTGWQIAKSAGARNEKESLRTNPRRRE